MNDRFKCFPLMTVPRYELLNPGPPVTDEVDPEPAIDSAEVQQASGPDRPTHP
jgi:hypothetical protein